MSKGKLTAGTTSHIATVFVNDASSIIGAGLSGITYNAPGFSGYYIRMGDATPTPISLASAVVGTYTSGGWIAVDNSKMQGVYQFGVPNAALAVGARSANIMLYGATNMVPLLLEDELDKVDYQTSITDVVTGVLIQSGVLDNVYYADTELIQDQNNNLDSYGVQWFKNSAALPSGSVTNPAFSVYNLLTGTALLSNRTLSYSSVLVGGLGKNETSLTSSGVPYLIVASGTIDGTTRIWQNVVGKL